MSNTIARGWLVQLLDGEAFISAADRIRAGEDPCEVLSEFRPFVPRYNDAASRRAIETLQDVVSGRIRVI